MVEVIKDVVKSKTMVGVLIFVLGVSYFGAPTNNLKVNSNNINLSYISN